MFIESGPDSLMMAMPPVPGGVDMAQMVSRLSSIVDGMLFISGWK